MKAKSLLDAMTFEELASLPFDNGDVGDFWFIRCGNDICIHVQKSGEKSKQGIRIPIAVMRKIVAKLTKKQTPRKRKAV